MWHISILITILIGKGFKTSFKSGTQVDFFKLINDHILSLVMFRKMHIFPNIVNVITHDEKK